MMTAQFLNYGAWLLALVIAAAIGADFIKTEAAIRRRKGSACNERR